MKAIKASIWSAAFFSAGFWIVSLFSSGKDQALAVFFFWAVVPLAFLVGMVICLCVLYPLARTKPGSDHSFH